MTRDNCYNDAARASAYAKLEFPGTYYLAYRDLPALIHQYVQGIRALDFGCGTGRSTRFLRGLGFRVVGIDIASGMIEHARDLDHDGDYRVLGSAELGGLSPGAWDLVFSAFSFDNIAQEDKPAVLRDIAGLLAPSGVFLNLISTPEIYLHEWASFSTKDFPENRHAVSGDRVRIVITDIADPRPVEDVLCRAEEYRSLYGQAGLELVQDHRPLATADEPYHWVNETRIAPWAIDVLKRSHP